MTHDTLGRVLSIEGIAPVGMPERIESESNDVWRVDDYVVRICWRGDRDRLLREARVAEQLPPEIGYPEIVAAGRDLEVSWMVTRALDGVPIQAVFEDLNGAARYAVGVSLGSLLRIVHGLRAPDGVDDRPGLDIVGEDVLPLPVSRARTLLDEVAVSQGLEPSLVASVYQRLEDLEALDPFVGSGSLLHCDAGIANLMWRDGRVVALLDFEWARTGEPWVDVLGHISYGDRDVATGVRDAYPEPFDVDSTHERLRLLELATALRMLAAWPGPKNVANLRQLAAAAG